MSMKSVLRVYIRGNSYAHRDAIKSLGGRWLPDDKMWTIRIQDHPLNTMRMRGQLASALRDLERKGVEVEYVNL